MSTQEPTANHFGPEQPGTHIDAVNDLTNEEFVRQTVPKEDDLRKRDCIQVIYQTSTPDTNSLDDLHDERLNNVESVLPNNTEYLVTTDIVHGDLFKFTHMPGTWKFVGTHVLDDQTLLFVPDDLEAQRAPLYPEYKTFLRADFAAKLGDNRGGSAIQRIQSPTATPDKPDNDADDADDADDTIESPGVFTRLGHRLDNLLGLN